jgi:hypothetical protein
MTSRFTPGAKVYTKDGRAYMVEEVADGIVYCSLPNGTETEFPESHLQTEQEWAAKSGGRRDIAYGRLKQSRVYAPPAVKLDGASSSRLLANADRLIPGLLDYVAFTTATRVLTENKDMDMLADLSIVKCRKIFDEATPQARVAMLGTVLGAAPETLLNASGLGDNMARAMLDKGMAAHAEAFEDFCDRPRR